MLGHYHLCAVPFVVMMIFKAYCNYIDRKVQKFLIYFNQQFSKIAGATSEKIFAVNFNRMAVFICGIFHASRWIR